ncbi:hypothetical protein [Nonomuraea sp. NPDC005650]|uniref:hypothetical protein n=1 Tax=Nonomuraea sp. NPDC005650 TaxID=3157045 RepID=UPI0033BB0741
MIATDSRDLSTSKSPWPDRVGRFPATLREVHGAAWNEMESRSEPAVTAELSRSREANQYLRRSWNRPASAVSFRQPQPQIRRADDGPSVRQPQSRHGARICHGLALVEVFREDPVGRQVSANVAGAGIRFGVLDHSIAAHQPLAAALGAGEQAVADGSLGQRQDHFGGGGDVSSGLGDDVSAGDVGDSDDSQMGIGIGPRISQDRLHRRVVGPPSQVLEQTITLSASEVARFGAWVEATNLGPATLDCYAGTVTRLARDYLHRPPAPLLSMASELTKDLFSMLRSRHQHLDQRRELYATAAELCSFMAWAAAPRMLAQ